MKNALLSLSSQAEPFPMETVVALLGHSLVIGTLLMVLATWIQLSSVGGKKKDAPLSPSDRFQSAVLQAANVLFVCFGVTGVMILVNNDLARAFAIAAAIAMIRFRVKMNEGAAAALFFAVVIGMACGVGQLPIAWGVGLVFIVIQSGLLLGLRLVKRESRGESAPAPSAPINPAN